MRAILLFLAVVSTHYGYDFVSSTPYEASWNFYIARGFEGSVLCWLLLPVFQKMNGWQRFVGVFAVILGIFEEGQTAVCGIAGKGIEVPLWSTLCIERFGPIPYLAITALAIVFLVNGITRNENRD